MDKQTYKRVQILIPEPLWRESTDRAFDTNHTGLSDYIRTLIRTDLEQAAKADQQ